MDNSIIKDDLFSGTFWKQHITPKLHSCVSELMMSTQPSMSERTIASLPSGERSLHEHLQRLLPTRTYLRIDLALLDPRVTSSNPSTSAGTAVVAEALMIHKWLCNNWKAENKSCRDVIVWVVVAPLAGGSILKVKNVGFYLEMLWFESVEWPWKNMRFRAK